MAAKSETKVTPVTRRTRIRRALLNGVATTLSQVAAPPMLAALMMFLAAGASGEPYAWQFAAAYVGLGLALPLAYLVFLVRRGLVSDLDVQKRHQRWRPLLAALFGMVGAVALFAVSGAPPIMLALAGGLLVYMAVAFTITLGWKISMHSAGMAALAMFSVRTYGDPALPLILAIPLMAWARVHLRRHTVAQTIAGAALGSTVIWLALTAM